MIMSPCKYCNARNLGCHDHCLEYLKYSQELKDIHSFMKGNDEFNAYASDRKTKLLHKVYS